MGAGAHSNDAGVAAVLGARVATATTVAHVRDIFDRADARPYLSSVLAFASDDACALDVVCARACACARAQVYVRAR